MEKDRPAIGRMTPPDLKAESSPVSPEREEVEDTLRRIYDAAEDEPAPNLQDRIAELGARAALGDRAAEDEILEIMNSAEQKEALKTFGRFPSGQPTPEEVTWGTRHSEFPDGNVDG